MQAMAFVCWRNDLLIPLRCAPYAWSGKRALSELRPAVMEALGIRRFATATARTAQISTNQDDTSASRLETVYMLLRPVESQKSKGPNGVEPHSGRCPSPRYHIGSKNIMSGSLISLVLPLNCADQYTAGIKVTVRCVAVRRSDSLDVFVRQCSTASVP